MKTDRHTTLQSYAEILRWTLVTIFSPLEAQNPTILQATDGIAHWLADHWDAAKLPVTQRMGLGYKQASSGRLSIYEILRLHDLTVDVDSVGTLSPAEEAFLEDRRALPTHTDLLPIVRWAIIYFCFDYQNSHDPNEPLHGLLSLLHVDLPPKTMHLGAQVQHALHKSLLMGSVVAEGDVFQPLEDKLNSLFCTEAANETQVRSPEKE